MKFSDLLSQFSVADLRTLAERRRIPLTETTLSSRQTLVRTLAAALDRHRSPYAALGGLNRLQLEVLRSLLGSGHPALSRVTVDLGLDPASAKLAFEQLRLWGLAFPEGDWEHVIIPGPTRGLEASLNGIGPAPTGGLARPVLRFTDSACESRPGSFGWDLAELLARAARSQIRVTQSARINRRDLKAMETALAIPVPAYPVFLALLSGAISLLGKDDAGNLVVSEAADAWLGQPEPARSRLFAAAWARMEGFAESSLSDPAEDDYSPLFLDTRRQLLLTLASDLPFGQAVGVDSLQRLLWWEAPLAFSHPDVNRDAYLVAARMVRSLYWLGLLAVDHPEAPRCARPTPLGMHVLRMAPDATLPPIPALIPEEVRFFLQPNAEAFAPPNLSPRTLFHLRRITGERKGGPTGVYPLTANSLRRALNTGSTIPQIVGFLERFSRTGLPDNLRSLVETTGRQHGRISLVPAGYVLVTDVPELLQELHGLRTVAPFLHRDLTERVTTVDAARIPELMRSLRARGYAPVNAAEDSTGPRLPVDPDVIPALTETAARPGLMLLSGLPDVSDGPDALDASDALDPSDPSDPLDASDAADDERAAADAEEDEQTEAADLDAI